MQQPARWWVGLPVLVGIAYLATQSLAPAIESRLKGDAEKTLEGLKESISDAAVTVAGRDLSVGGLATSPQERDRALAVVAAIEGVRNVEDRTEPLALAHPFPLTLRRTGAKVEITGSLPPGETRGRLRAALAEAGLGVEDRAAWAVGAPPVFGELARFAALRLVDLDPGVATLNDAALTLEGEARPNVDYQALTTAANAPPKGARLESVDIERAAVSPFVLSAKFEGGVLTLRGSAPSKAIEEIRALAAKLAPSHSATERLAAAGGAPPQFRDAVAAGLAALAKLDNGSLTVADRLVTLAGEAPAGASVGESLARALPQGYGLAVQVAARAPAEVKWTSP
jgi:OOP family OmpA-OmpF porin